jgi:hypothetical protein
MRYRSTLLLMDAFPGAVFIDICKDPNGNQCCAAQGKQTFILYHNAFIQNIQNLCLRKTGKLHSK